MKIGKEAWSMGSLRVRHDWATSLSLFTFMHWRRKWQPTPWQLPWEIPWTEEGYSSWGSKRVSHDLATEQKQIFIYIIYKYIIFKYIIYKLTSLSFSFEKEMAVQYSCLENCRDGGAWWAAVCMVAQSWTRLKWLSSSRREWHDIFKVMKEKNL